MSNQAQLLFRQAVELHKKGDLAAAEKLYRQILAADPRHFDTLHMLGILSAQQGREAEALEQLAAALAINPGDAKAWFNAANVQRSSARFAEALASYDKALALGSGGAEILIGRAAALRELERFEEALASLDKVLALRPDDLKALNNRGNILLDLKRFGEALASLDRALAVRPEDPVILTNRGNALRGLNRLAEALASYDKALAGKPDFAETLNNRADVLCRLGRLEEALQSCEGAIRQRPDYAEAHYNRGNILHDLERDGDALASYARAIEIKPGMADALNNQGNILRGLKRLDEALASFDLVIQSNPAFAEAHNNRANALSDLRRWDEALAGYDRAIALAPDYARAHGNKANPLQALGQLDEALASLDRAIQLQPDQAEAFSNRGNVLKDLGRFDEALASYDRALALSPEAADLRLNKGMCCLLLQRFAEGWPLYEGRRKHTDRARPRIAAPAWTGAEDINGKKLLVYAEQGYGDTIQFCRYLELVRARGAEVIFSAPPRLLRLLRTLNPEVQLIGGDTPPPDFDYQVPLLSLPLAFRTDGDTIPARVPYLGSEAGKVEAWKAKLGPSGFKIGFAWQANLQAVSGPGRSIPLRHFAALATLPGVRLISLQKDDGIEQLQGLPSGMMVETLGSDFDSGPDAFIDTAAVMQNLDLIVTADTAIAHLAGALGRPAWVGLSDVPDWRWFLERSDSPWYPATRLFRQSTRGDWPGVFADMRVRLEQFLAERL
jgi:tetratricopeptide (TPR) repeat protein